MHRSLRRRQEACRSLNVAAEFRDFFFLGPPRSRSRRTTISAWIDLIDFAGWSRFQNVVSNIPQNVVRIFVDRLREATSYFRSN
jgi:hypothetical protein